MSPETIMLHDGPKVLKFKSLELIDHVSAHVTFELSFPTYGKTPDSHEPISLAVVVAVDYLDEEEKLPDMKGITRTAARKLESDFVTLQKHSHQIGYGIEKP